MTTRLWLSISVLVLAGCAGYSPSDLPAGASLDAVRSQLGEPSARYPLANGATRLEHARGPYGKHTYMVDVDANGRVVSWVQVLTETRFGAIPAGMQTREVLAAIGTPSERRKGGRQGDEVWSWRYESPFCQWFQVAVLAGRVKDSGYQPDPLCDVDVD